MPILKKILILFLIGFLVYLPSFWNQFLWDDEQFIYKNQYVLTADIPKIFTTNTIAGAGQQSDYYRPLTTLSFAIDHAIWGLRPFGFHLTNTLLHTLSGILLFLVLKELNFDNEQKKNKNSFWPLTLGFWISAIFMVHPIQTEAVVYMNSRGDSLFTFFAFASLFTLALSFRKEIKIKIYENTLQLTKVLLLFLSSVFYILSILSKEIGIMIIGLQFLVVTLIVIHKRSKKSESLKLCSSATLPLCIYSVVNIGIASAYLYLRSTILNFQNSFNLYGMENIYTSSIFVRLYTFSKIIWTYFRLLILPYPLHMERDSDIITNPLNIYTIGIVLLGLIILSLIVYEWKKQKTIWIFFSSAWFIGGLIPTSGIIPINGLIYEHWLYIPMIGFFMFLFSVLSFLSHIVVWDKLRQESIVWKQIKMILMSSIFVIYIILTLRQNFIWSTPIRLYEHILKYSETARVHNNLAMAYAEDNQHQKAITEYHKAIDLADAYPQTHYNLANTYLKIGNIDKAQAELEKSIKMNPNFLIAYPTLINIYLYQEKYQQILPLIDKLIETEPDNQQFQTFRQELLQKIKPTAY